MPQEKSPARHRLETIERQEEKIWVAFYPEVRRDETLAAEILTELERDETLRRRHRGLYLCCQRCIRLHESRETRNRRIGRAVRSLLRAVFISFPRAVAETLGQGRNVAVACLPEMEEEPAAPQVRRLMESDAYAQAEKSFRERARKAADKTDTGTHALAAEDTAPAVRPSAAG